ELSVSSRLLDDRVDRGDACRERATGRVLSRDAHGLPDSHLAEVLLRHAEIHIGRIERLQRSNWIAARQILAEINLTEAEDSRKRCPDRLPCDGGPDLLNLCFRLRLLGHCLLLLGHSPIVFRASDRAFIHKTMHALEIETRKLVSGLNAS